MENYFYDHFVADKENNVSVDIGYDYEISHLHHINYTLFGFECDDFDEEIEMGYCEVSMIEELNVYLKDNEYSLPDVNLGLSSVQIGINESLRSVKEFWKDIKEYGDEGILDEEYLEDIGYPVGGKIAIVRLFELYEEFKGGGNGKKALGQILQHLKSEGANFIILYPYPFRLDIEGTEAERMITFNKMKLRKFYGSFGFKMTKGQARSENGTPIHHMILNVDNLVI